MKNFKKVLSTALAFALSASILPSAVLAEGEEAVVETVYPEVLMYRDYENYAGELDFLNGSGSYGTLEARTNGNFFNKAEDIQGEDGTGVQMNAYTNTTTSTDETTGEETTTTSYTVFGSNVDGTLANPIFDGKLYIGFNMKMKDEPIVNSENEGYIQFNAKSGSVTDTTMRVYPIYYYSNNASNLMIKKGSTSTNAGSTIVNIEPQKNYKVEMVVDIDNCTIDYYINGEHYSDKQLDFGSKKNTNVIDSTKSWGIYNFYMRLCEGIDYFDNFTMVHYPANVSAQTFSMSAGSADVENNTLSVVLNSDATDVDTSVTTDETTGEETSTTTTYTAPYGITLANELTADLFTVTKADGTAVAVSEVTRGAKTGEYVIKLAEEFPDDETYTVSTNAALTDILGATLNENASSAALDIIAPNVLLYRDYEDYTGGATNLANVKSKYTYGTFQLYANSNFHKQATAVTGTDGIGVQLNTYKNVTTAEDGTETVEEIIKNGMSGKTLPSVAEDGTVYIGFDIARKTDAELEEQDGNATTQHQNYISTTGTAKTYAYFYTQYTGLKKAWEDAKGVGNIMIGDTTQRFEIVYDLDNDLITAYVDGVKKDSYTFTGTIKTIDFIQSNGIGYFDNFTMIHYPKGVKAQTFSMKAGKADAENKTLSVTFNSDVKGGNATRGYDYTAPYGVTVTSDVTADMFAVKKSDGTEATVTAVAKGVKSGEYVLTLAEDIAAGETYTISTDASLKDLLGAALKGNTAVITTEKPAEPVFEVKSVTQDSQTFTATYINTTGEPESFVLIAAAYDATTKALTEVKSTSVTAVSEAGEKTASVTLTEDITGKTVKYFVWDGFATMKPIEITQ